MPGDDYVVFVDQNRIDKTEDSDAIQDLTNLALGVSA
jgi:hypothetical protein